MTIKILIKLYINYNLKISIKNKHFYLKLYLDTTYEHETD